MASQNHCRKYRLGDESVKFIGDIQLLSYTARALLTIRVLTGASVRLHERVVKSIRTTDRMDRVRVA